jgi:hypothetical protein
MPGISSLKNGSNQNLPAIGDNRGSSQHSSKQMPIDHQNSKEL